MDPSGLFMTQRPVQHMTAAALAQLPADVVLQMTLRTTSVISTFSSFALRERWAVRPELRDFTQIGEGLQAAVFEQAELPLVMKKEKPGNENLRSNLQREYPTHLAVQAAFDRYGPSIRPNILLPIAYDFIPCTQERFLDRYTGNVSATISDTRKYCQHVKNHAAAESRPEGPNYEVLSLPVSR
jgi:hypothetical protein